MSAGLSVPGLRAETSIHRKLWQGWRHGNVPRAGSSVRRSLLPGQVIKEMNTQCLALLLWIGGGSTVSRCRDGSCADLSCRKLTVEPSFLHFVSLAVFHEGDAVGFEPLLPNFLFFFRL